MHENEISKIIFDLGLKIHKNLGPGLLESAYEECLFYEISKAGLFVEKQKPKTNAINLRRSEIRYWL